MSSRNELAIRILNVVLNRKSVPSFSKLLGVSSVPASDLQQQRVKFNFKVPPNLCVVYNNHPKPQLALSAAIALFDELSTSGLVIKDRTCRPGVSVQLDGRLHAPALVGEEVTISTTAVKIGANLGFCTLELHNQSGTLLASGNHIKYLPMGKYWDFVMGNPKLLSLLLPLVENNNPSFIIKKIQSVLMKSSKSTTDSSPEVNREVIGAVFQQLNVAQQQQQGRNSTYIVPGAPFLNNPMGKMHGGAIAMAVEKAVSIQASDATTDTGYLLTEMDLRYLNAVKVRTVIIIYYHYDFSTLLNAMRCHAMRCHAMRCMLEFNFFSLSYFCYVTEIGYHQV